MQIKKVQERYIQMQMGTVEIYTFPLQVKDLVKISYVAVRGRDEEEGAVQRVLNRKRIASIKQYILDGNMFVNTFVINWNDSNYKPEFENAEIKIPLVDSVAQLLDGQHRLEGLKEAMKLEKNIGEKQILVSMVIGLGTKEAAKIFININSEQKPVPKSLIFDLYGVTDDDKNFAITRSDDIAKELNENVDSPYYNLIKYPGSPRGKGNSDMLLSNNIDNTDVYHWMMKKREEVNYKDLDFHDPSAPDFWSELNNEIEIHGIRTTIDKMVNDNWLYCFQDEYAILGIPTKRIILTVNEIHRQGRQLEILEEKKQLIDSMSTILSENSVQALEIWKRS